MHASHPASRRGFTLVELLVVIAIIGVLVALLLPAVQAAREAARRTSCVNNLHNLALATINYHDAQGHFPVDEDYSEFQPAGVTDPFLYRKPGNAVLGGGGWIVEVLPQLEQQPLYARFKPYLNGMWAYGQKTGLNANVPDLREALKSQPAILNCPSNELVGPRDDQYPFSSTSQVTGAPVAVAVTHYKGNAGDGSFEFQSPPRAPAGFWTYNPFDNCYRSGIDCYGIFWRYTYARGGVKLKEITDGTSNTLLMGEASPEDGNSPAWSSDGDWALTGVELNWNWKASGECLDSSGNLNTGGVRCYSQMRGFRGYHVGGVNFALVDGSVKFISDNITHTTLRYLSTKAGDETINETL